MVSIIVPVYNRENTIAETIESVLNQNSRDWELILVDDGSTDSSLDIIKEFSAKDSRIKFLNRGRGPKGAPTCRNLGVQQSQYEWIIFLDSDDLLAEHCIKQRIESTDDLDIDFAVFETYEFKNHPRNIIGIFNNYPKQDQDYLAMFLEYHLPWQTMSAIWSKDFINTIGGYSENLARFQDVDFHIKALRFSAKFRVFKYLSPDSFYRVGTDGFTGDRFITNQTLAARIFVENILSEDVPPLQEYYKRCLKKGIYKLIQRYFNNTKSHLWDDNYTSIIRIGREKDILNWYDFAILKTFLFAWSQKLTLVKHFKLIGLLNRIISLKIIAK